MKYKVKCRIDFADGDYSIEDYDGEIYITKDEAEAVVNAARVMYELDAWIAEEEEGE